MNKKGDTQKILFFIFYLLIAATIMYFSTAYISNYFDGMEFNKEFIAKDLGLSIDTLAFSPNEIKMDYNLSQEFISENKNNKLNIKLKNLEISKEYIFISNIDDFSKESNEITIKKRGKIII